MPLFNNSAGFQIHGGTFYDVAGDVNLQFQRSAPRARRDVRGVGLGMECRTGAEDPPSRLPRPKTMRVGKLSKGLTLTTTPKIDSRSSSPQSLSDYFPHGIIVHAEKVLLPPPKERSNGMQILHSGVALSALFDSADSFPQPKCHPDTRLAMLDGLFDWASGIDGIDSGRRSRALSELYGWLPVPRYTRLDASRPILWLRGPFGAGKSAILQTLCAQLRDAGLLGGSFFFRRGHPTCGDASVLFATLAYQIALNDPQMKGPVERSVEYDPSVMVRSMAAQVESLILAPFRELQSSSCPATPRVLVIDGLDECDGPLEQEEVLHSIRRILREFPSPPLKIIIASRAEPDLQDTFHQLSAEGLCETLNIDQSFGDVRNYLRHEFERIYQSATHRRSMAGVPLPWPAPSVLRSLVDKSSGYFIYPTTVIKLVDDKDARPVEQLQAILNPALDHDFHSSSPIEALDKLYIQILGRVPLKARARLLDILSVVTAGFALRPRHIEQLLDLPSGEVHLILRHLHSVLELDDDDTRPVVVNNASFTEFLQDEKRSQMFCIGGLQRRMDLARAVYRVFECIEGAGRDDVAWKLVDVWHIYCANLHVVPSAI